jgi:cell wall-associated NlpC family hydrolase
MTVTRDAVVRAARGWMGTPFLHGQSLKGKGVDCIGLLIGVAYELGLADGRPETRAVIYNGYGRQPKPDLLRQACAEYFDPIENAGLGDVLLMRFDREPQHFALVSDAYPMYIIHAYANARQVVEHRLSLVWQARIVGAYRWKGVAWPD